MLICGFVCALLAFASHGRETTLWRDGYSDNSEGDGVPSLTFDSHASTHLASILRERPRGSEQFEDGRRSLAALFFNVPRLMPRRLIPRRLASLGRNRLFHSMVTLKCNLQAMKNNVKMSDAPDGASSGDDDIQKLYTCLETNGVSTKTVRRNKLSGYGFGLMPRVKGGEQVLAVPGSLHISPSLVQAPMSSKSYHSRWFLCAAAIVAVIVVMGALMSGRREQCHQASSSEESGACKNVSDNVQACIDKILNSATDGEGELDQHMAPGVRVVTLSPKDTGFPEWSRDEEHGGDQDRGQADWMIPEGATNESPRILYTHGGGYEYYSPQDVYRPTTSRLAAASGMAVLAIDYRLCPEHKHPAQLEDAVQAFRWIAENGPFGPAKAKTIFVAGDSAGGGLALALALRLRDAPVAEAQLAGIIVASPQTDMTCSGESYTSRRWKEGGGPQCDPIFRGEDPTGDSMPQIELLLGEQGVDGSYALTDPALSVIHADLHDLPPTLIHVGDAEVMRCDSVEFANKAVAAGSPVEVRVWPRMWHTFTQYTEGCGGEDSEPLKEALDAVQQQGDFLRAHSQ